MAEPDSSAVGDTAEDEPILGELLSSSEGK